MIQSKFGVAAEALLAVGLLAGCTPPAPEAANNRPEHIKMIGDLQKYWQSLGYTGLVLQLETVLPGEVATCENRIPQTGEKVKHRVRSNEYSPGRYCTVGQKIVLSMETVEAWTTTAPRLGIDPAAVEAYLLAHEAGHGVEDEAGTLEDTVGAERQADCLAAQAMANLYRKWVDDAELLFGDKGPFEADSPTHGPRAMRADSFRRGAAGEGCGNGIPTAPPTSAPPSR